MVMGRYCSHISPDSLMSPFINCFLGSKIMSDITPLEPLARSASVTKFNVTIIFIPMASSILCTNLFVPFLFIFNLPASSPPQSPFVPCLKALWHPQQCPQHQNVQNVSSLGTMLVNSCPIPCAVKTVSWSYEYGLIPWFACKIGDLTCRVC